MDNDYSYGSALRPGMSLNGGYYVIEGKIGEEGFGITYKATQKKLNRTVCIKEFFLMGRCTRDTHSNRVIPNSSEFTLYNNYRERFSQEAQTLAKLYHPGIVEIIDVFDENGTSYMVMPFIEGQSLQNIVENQGPLPYSLAINYMAKVSDTVSYIHKRHFLHRDIKPANIMITSDFKDVLIDFGPARELEHDKTQAPTSLLSHGYAPLEQYSTTGRKGYFTDIYAMGATFYFILTGRVPLAAAARVTEQMPEPAQLNSQIPTAANNAIMKAMQLQPQNRYQNVEDFMRDLQIHGSARTSSTMYPKRKNRWLVWMLVGIVILAVAVVTNVVINSFSKKSLEETSASTKKTRLKINANNVDFEMIFIDGGTYVMGGSNPNIEYKQNELPPHQVTLSSFYISKYEVTQELWEAVMGNNPSEFQGTNLPVENVSWYDCQSFIYELNRITGKCFRLPTEAEWEYAAKGGSNQENYEFAGSDIISSVAWSKSSSCNKTHPVGQKDSNQCGLYDMSGNVYEWCSDWYGLYSSRSTTNPQGPGAGTNKVFRGGSWKYSDVYCRVTYRPYTKPSGKYHNLGFRIVLDVEGDSYKEKDIPQEEEKISLEESMIIKKYIFKATRASRNHYGEYKVKVHWPESINGREPIRLQQALALNKRVLKSLIASECEDLFPSYYWQRVSSKPENDEYDDEILEEGYFPYPPSGSISIERAWIDNIAKIVAYDIVILRHLGCGMGACIYIYEEEIIYDVKRDKIVYFDDIINSEYEYAILEKLKLGKHPYHNLNGGLMETPQRVPHNIFFRDNICYFRFEKYEIGCGADGNVALGIPLSELKPYMTSYGQELFSRFNN